VNKALRTSAWRDGEQINIEVVYMDTLSKSKWSSRIVLTPEQAKSFAERLAAAGSTTEGGKQ